MKKVLYTVAIAAMLFSCGNEESKEQITTDVVNNPSTAATDASADTNTDVPKMVFEEEVYDFGTISQGEKAAFSYNFTNEGTSELIITSAKGSCGCTVPSWPKEPIAPGASATIDVVFDSNGKKGVQNKKVTIVANTMPATNVVALKGEVLAPETK
jgi:hypothetical protein